MLENYDKSLYDRLLATARDDKLVILDNNHVSSATSGKVEYFKKVKEPIFSSPVISNGKLFVLTENSKIIGFN